MDQLYLDSLTMAVKQRKMNHNIAIEGVLQCIKHSPKKAARALYRQYSNGTESEDLTAEEVDVELAEQDQTFRLKRRGREVLLYYDGISPTIKKVKQVPSDEEPSTFSLTISPFYVNATQLYEECGISTTTTAEAVECGFRDLLPAIASHLSIRDAASLRLVCKRWSRALHPRAKIWEEKAYRLPLVYFGQTNFFRVCMRWALVGIDTQSQQHLDALLRNERLFSRVKAASHILGEQYLLVAEPTPDRMFLLRRRPRYDPKKRRITIFPEGVVSFAQFVQPYLNGLLANPP